ncbi:MAG: lamin tail domain-containing protein [Flavobacteriales bacterium]|nr:MAG: lamin tail domain-containing protein [Flavobacteriales bacterium]
MSTLRLKNRLQLSVGLLLASVALNAQTVFINEIHYDNTGADVGEGVEVAGPAGTDLTGWVLQPYNGSGGATYTPLANLTGTIPDLGGGYGTLFFAISGLQNGAPDGIALVNAVPALVQFLSYEGSFLATNGAASGQNSTDILGIENGSNAVGTSLQLQGTGTVYTDFSWTLAPIASTYNLVNTGQTFGGGGGGDPVVGFAAPTGSTTEGGSASIGVTMDIAPASNVTVTINDDLSGTATDGVDYTTFTDVVLTFTPTDTYPFTQNVALTTTGDVDYEANETVVLNCNVTSGTADLGISQHTHSILNDDLPQLVINEIDYDQSGTDALEFIELKNTGAAAIDLLGLKVELVNGSNNSVYSTFTLPSALVAAGDYFVICATGSAVPNCDFQSGAATNLIQNGAPDGVRLATTGNIVIDQMSYEGSMSTTEGTAPVDIDSGNDPQQGLSRLPDGQDTDDNSADFSLRCTSPGESNFSTTQFCLCEPPSFTAFPSCIDGSTWNIVVNVSSTGSGATVDITNSLTGASALGVGTGTHVIGPFNNFDIVDLLVAHETFSDCDETLAGITEDCTPPPPCFDNECELTILTDNFPNEITWSISVAGGGPVVCSGGPYFLDFNTEVELCCLPDGCYDLAFNDGFGDGITDPVGAITLRDQFGNRIIDSDATYTSLGQANQPFCLPLGTDKLTIATCDREDLSPTSVIVASPNPAVSAEFGIGNQADDGYQFLILDPDGGYSRSIYKSHANPGSPGGPAGPTACAHLKLSSIVTLPVPTDRLLNVRVRSRVNGVYGAYGPACRMKVLSTPIACPTAQLDNNPLHIGTTYSCGVTGKVVGASGNAGKIWAEPLAGANRYRFEFSYPAESYTRTITLNTYVLPLNAWQTNPLLCGTVEYNVRVQASFDGGATFCPYGTACTVEITNDAPNPCTGAPEFAAGSLNITPVEAGQMTMYPNPVVSGRITLQLTQLPATIASVQFDMVDLFGKQVQTHTIATGGADEISTVVELPSTMATGVYLVTVTVGDTRYVERLVVE